MTQSQSVPTDLRSGGQPVTEKCPGLNQHVVGRNERLTGRENGLAAPLQGSDLSAAAYDIEVSSEETHGWRLVSRNIMSFIAEPKSLGNVMEYARPR
jgi:hypothetical protein